MPRKRNPQNEKARLRQERYRERLAQRHEPEIDAIDTALAVGIAALMISDKVPEKTILRIGMAAIESLKGAGYSGKLAGSLIHRRLTWLREVLKNPDADHLTKRGFYDVHNGILHITSSLKNGDIKSHVVTPATRHGPRADTRALASHHIDDEPF